ncbi:MAG TPA: glycosyltransferase family 4 protein [Cytophagaceae bacterium]|jgi:glycosyltransferase involved in cell wall biosynthesis|nr:glycosyltransferase family 4 protein [Cytophagaceae bacterium]
MRIAQVSPLYESVPPKLYGGTERIVSYLTEELVRQGHDVTLFASGDSVSNAKLISPCEKALRLDISCMDQIAPHFTMLEMLYKQIENFDLIHYHIDYLHYPLSRRYNYVPSVTTLHGRLDSTELLTLYKEYKEIPVVSISNDQRKPLADANWQKTIYHGLPLDLYKGYESEGKYLAFIGRISKEKRPDRAIEIAKMAGIPLKIAAKVAKPDEEYYNNIIKPMIDGDPLIEFIGEIGEKDKNEFLGNAIAMLFPIDWPEPFGLVMIESMACGTPVIAWKHGSVPEIIEHGVSGFIVQSVEESVEAVKNISSISRKQVRKDFEKRFSSKVMTNNYLDLYEDLKNVKQINEAKYLNF